MGKTAPRLSPPVPSVDEALVPDLPANLERLPAPAIAPAVTRKNPATVNVALERGRSPGCWSRGSVTIIGRITEPCRAR